MARMHQLDDPADQIDVGQYVAVLGRRWKLVLGVTVAAIILAVVSTTILAQVAPRYQSTVTILLTGPRYRISFDPKFTNIDSVTAPAINRIDEYRIIATSPEVHLAVIQALSGQLTPQDIGEVDISITVRGQLITVTAAAEDPDRAKAVGNAYATAVATRLDTVYGQADQSRQVIAKTLAETVEAHQAAQDQLTAFVRESRIDALALQIAQKEATMQGLAEERVSSTKNQAAAYYGAVTEADQIIRAASSLRDQVQAAVSASVPATGASLSLATLQSRLATLGTPGSESHVSLSRDPAGNRDVNRGPNQDTRSADRIPVTISAPNAAIPPRLQIQLNADSLQTTDADPGALLTSIDALIASAKAQQADARRSIDTLSQQVASGNAGQEGATVDATIAQLAREIAALQAEYRQQMFRHEALSQNVEQMRSTRSTLEAKLSEANVAAAEGLSAAVVAAGSSASLPRVWPPSLWRSVLVATTAGLLLGTLIALVLEWKSTRRSSRAPLAEHPISSPATATR